MQQTKVHHHPQVVVIDDNPIDHFLAATLVRQLSPNQEAICFHTADEGLLFLRNLTPAAIIPLIILLDINMPVKSGFDFLEAYGGLSSAIHEHCHVIMLSSSVAQPEIEQAQSSPHVRCYLSKPLTAEKLKAVFDEISPRG